MNSKLVALSALVTSALVVGSVQAQTIGCSTGGAGGIIPSSGTGGGGTFPTTLPTAPSLFPLTVAALPPGATAVTEVKLIGLTHTYVTDLHFVLTDPNNVTHNLFCRGTSSTGAVFSCDLGGDYTFVPSCTIATNSLPTACTSPTIFAPGSYDQLFGNTTNAWPSGTNGIVNTRIDAIPAQTGVWTLAVYDWAGADTGALTTWELCFGTPFSPSAPSAAPALTAPAAGASLFGPTVNLTWSADPCSTSYQVDVDGTLFNTTTNSYAYTSAAGTHTWTVRGVNGSGNGPWASSRQFTDLGAPPSPCNGPSVSTLFATNNGLGSGSCVYFDVDVLNPAGVNVAQFETNTDAAVAAQFSLAIYTRPGSYAGFEQTSVGWAQVASGVGVALGQNQPSLVDVVDFPLAPGVTGFCLVITGGGHRYTNGTGANQFFSDANLSITLGKSQATPFSSAPISPRVWNGTIRYNCTPPGPVSYCTAGTSTNGCTAIMSATGNPSASQATPCSITIGTMEGQKSGIVFYGLASNPQPWCGAGGGTSFLCVKAPTQRTVAANSGGTLGGCNGSITLDWNAFQTANPGALGTPWASGAKVYVQGWYRDPPACKTTSMSDALDMTYVP